VRLVIANLEVMLGKSFLYQSYLYKILSYKVRSGFVIIRTDSDPLKLPLNKLQDSLKLFIETKKKKYVEDQAPVIDDEFVIMKLLVGWWMGFW